eukprot:COSAG06_NODE_2881_length_6137_cov_2.388972_2_plen_155_part_00
MTDCQFVPSHNSHTAYLGQNATKVLRLCVRVRQSDSRRRWSSELVCACCTTDVSATRPPTVAAAAPARGGAALPDHIERRASGRHLPRFPRAAAPSRGLELALSLTVRRVTMATERVAVKPSNIQILPLDGLRSSSVMMNILAVHVWFFVSCAG